MKAMSLAVLLSAAAAIIVSGLGAPTARPRQNKPLPNGSEVKQQILELERRWQRAVLNRDRPALESLLTKTFSEQEIEATIERIDGIDGIRTIKRQPYIELVMNSAFRTYEISQDIRVDLKDPATAIASLKLLVAPKTRIVPLSLPASRRGDYDVVDTWVKGNQVWQVSLRQARAARRTIVPLRN
jgi:hypothetical protein